MNYNYQRKIESTGEKRRETWGVILAVPVLAALLLTGCGGSEKAGVPAALKEESGTVTATLGEEPIYVEEAQFYMRMLQEQWEYELYDDFGADMWQQEAGENGETLEEVLKSNVLDTLTELHLLCAHAEEYGVTLTEEEQEAIRERAANFMKTNTEEVLREAGADAETVERYLTRNELASRTAQAIQDAFEPGLTEEDARVGRLTYALFSVTGTYDAEGNHTAFTEEEIAQIQKDAEAFAARARELGDITAAGGELNHTVIDVYFGDDTNGGAHPQVAEAARALKPGGVSDVIQTEDGWYVVQHVTDYDEEATQENLEALTEDARQQHLLELEDAWEKETPLTLEESVWETVQVKGSEE